MGSEMCIRDRLEGEAVTLIEWGDQIVPSIPQNYLEIRFEYGQEDDHRIVKISHIGSSWHKRIEQLQGALSEWSIKQ